MRKFINKRTGEIVSFFAWEKTSISKYLDNKGGNWKEVFSNE